MLGKESERERAKCIAEKNDIIIKCVLSVKIIINESKWAAAMILICSMEGNKTTKRWIVEESETQNVWKTISRHNKWNTRVSQLFIIFYWLGSYYSHFKRFTKSSLIWYDVQSNYPRERENEKKGGELKKQLWKHQWTY